MPRELSAAVRASDRPFGCEDTRSERFLVGLCKARGIDVTGVEKAPKGKGSASDWGLARYRTLVRKTRSKNFQLADCSLRST